MCDCGKLILKTKQEDREEDDCGGTLTATFRVLLHFKGLKCSDLTSNCLKLVLAENLWLLLAKGAAWGDNLLVVDLEPIWFS